MKTITTLFIETGIPSTESEKDRILRLAEEARGKKFDTILCSLVGESLQVAQKVNELLRPDLQIDPNINFNYNKNSSDLVLKIQIVMISQLLKNKEYSNKIVLIICHKEIIERLVAKSFEASLEEARAMRRGINQYRCLQQFID